MSARFYRVSTSSDPEIIGDLDGFGQVELGIGSPSERNQFKIVSEFLKQNVYTNPDRAKESSQKLFIPRGRMAEGAIPTDFMSYYPLLVGVPFLVSSRAAISLLRVVGNSASLHDVGRVDDCPYKCVKLFQAFFLPSEYIEFRKSKFFFGNVYEGKKYIDISCEKDLISAIQMDAGILSADRVVLCKDSFGKFPVFYIPTVGLIVTADVVSVLVSDSLSGLRFVPIESEIDVGRGKSIRSISLVFTSLP